MRVGTTGTNGFVQDGRVAFLGRGRHVRACTSSGLINDSAKAMPMTSPPPDVRLDAAERPQVAIPFMPEFAIASTFLLIAAPIAVVAAAAIAALLRRRRHPAGGGTDDGPEAGSGRSS